MNGPRKFQEDFWGTMTENYTKGVKLSTDLYEKTVNFTKEIWTNTSVENQQEKIVGMMRPDLRRSEPPVVVDRVIVDGVVIA